MRRKYRVIIFKAKICFQIEFLSVQMYSNLASIRLDH